MINDLLYKEIIERMNEYQSKIKYKTLGSEILLLALMSIEDSMTSLILQELNVTEEVILDIINNSYYIRDEHMYTYTLKEIFKKAEELQKNKDFVYDEAYLYSILENKDCVALDILKSLEIDGNQISDELLNALSYLEEDNKLLINLTKKARNNELNKLIGRKDILNNIDNIYIYFFNIISISSYTSFSFINTFSIRIILTNANTIIIITQFMK
jgi:ATP-dependent Clp protease ATP-binding subunit ClpA